MQFNRVNNKEYLHSSVGSGADTCSCVGIACALDWDILVLQFLGCFCMVARLSGSFSPRPLPSSPLSTVFHCDKCLSLLPVWGLIPRLPGFARYDSSLHIGAGCRGIARISKGGGGSHFLHQGTHHIVMSRIFWYETNYNKVSFLSMVFGAKVLKILQICACLPLTYCTLFILKNKKSHTGGSRAPQDPPPPLPPSLRPWGANNGSPEFLTRPTSIWWCICETFILQSCSVLFHKPWRRYPSLQQSGHPDLHCLILPFLQTQTEKTKYTHSIVFSWHF